MSNGKRWFCALDGQRKGPFSAFQLSEMVRHGVVVPETPIWTDGMPDWQTAAVCQAHLFTAPAPSSKFESDQVSIRKWSSALTKALGVVAAVVIAWGVRAGLRALMASSPALTNAQEAWVRQARVALESEATADQARGLLQQSASWKPCPVMLARAGLVWIIICEQDPADPRMVEFLDSERARCKDCPEAEVILWLDDALLAANLKKPSKAASSIRQAIEVLGRRKEIAPWDATAAKIAAIFNASDYAVEIAPVVAEARSGITPESDPESRGVIQAIAPIALFKLGRVSEARTCLEGADPIDRLSPKLRFLVTFWRIQGLAATDQIAAAKRLARQAVADATGLTGVEEEVTRLQSIANASDDEIREEIREAFSTSRQTP